jgi:hypothetical protein
MIIAFPFSFTIFAQRLSLQIKCSISVHHFEYLHGERCWFALHEDFSRRKSSSDNLSKFESRMCVSENAAIPNRSKDKMKIWKNNLMSVFVWDPQPSIVSIAVFGLLMRHEKN